MREVGTTVHVSLSVRDAITWRKSQLRKLVPRDGGGYLSPVEAIEWLLDHLQEGRRFLPFGKPCNGFSFETGCPGHRDEERQPSGPVPGGETHG